MIYTVYRSKYYIPIVQFRGCILKHVVLPITSLDYCTGGTEFNSRSHQEFNRYAVEMALTFQPGIRTSGCSATVGPAEYMSNHI